VLAIVLSIGIPIWVSLHGQPYNPAFSLFAAWGVAALGGCFGSLHTYYLNDPSPPKPPRGGIPVLVLAPPVAARASSEPTLERERRAA
jgi:hypothetical protein